MTLTVQNGSFSYKKGAALLENISLEAERGDVLAILGPNGAGKTTLLRCMLNLCRWKKGQTLLRRKKTFNRRTTPWTGWGFPRLQTGAAAN